MFSEIRALVIRSIEDGRLKEAVSQYRGGDRLNPEERASLAFLIGEALEEAGDVRSAEALYRDALLGNPNITPYKQNLASNLFDQGRYDESYQLLQEIAAETDKTYPLYQCNKSRLSEIERLRGDQSSRGASLSRGSRQSAAG